jgi:hypothetical protein
MNTFDFKSQLNILSQKNVTDENLATFIELINVYESKLFHNFELRDTVAEFAMRISEFFVNLKEFDKAVMWIHRARQLANAPSLLIEIELIAIEIFYFQNKKDIAMPKIKAIIKKIPDNSIKMKKKAQMLAEKVMSLK